MSGKNRVIWREGLFIKPQHFQQQQKHNDYLAHSRLTTFIEHYYGFSSLTIDKDLLALGRISITEASGIMPDGTIFSIPHQDAILQPLNVTDINGPGSKNIYLALPITNDTFNEISHPESRHAGAVRYRAHINNIRDLHTDDGDVSPVTLAQLTPILKQGSEDLSAFSLLPLCRIKEGVKGAALALDEDFIPTCTAVKVSEKLQRYMGEIENTLTERAQTLAKQIGSPGQQGVADVSEFMMLQLLNRVHPWFTHYSKQALLHPQDFFTQVLQTWAELKTFTDKSRLVGNIPNYDHSNLTDTFLNLMRHMRREMNVVLMPRAVALPLQIQGNGFRVATIHDPDLLHKAALILAVRAQIPQEQLRRQFVQQIKVASQEKIREMVSVQLPGVAIEALSAAPRQLPYHVGYTYFCFDQQGPAWQEILKGNSIAFHVSGEFPGLDMQLWAVSNGID
ncbi:type VI secretion protein [Photorhabdus luminescens]|nr:type VI secretion protein [Photorhabdus luminescens]